MLINFTFNNFNRFKESTTFSLLRTKINKPFTEGLITCRTNLSVVPAAMVMSCSSISKTSFITALSFLHDTVLKGCKYVPSSCMQFNAEFYMEDARYSYNLIVGEQKSDNVTRYNFPIQENVYKNNKLIFTKDYTYEMFHQTGCPDVYKFFNSYLYIVNIYNLHEISSYFSDDNIKMMREKLGVSNGEEFTPFLLALRKGVTVVCDNLYDSTDINALAFWLDCFHNPQINSNKGQIVFVSNNLGLLSDKFFRPDEITFISNYEKNKSQLVRLSSFETNLRKSGKWVDNYLEHKYIPSDVNTDSAIKLICKNKKS